jgi:ABC-type multidrug transport system fused ATPase/permease subunit
MFVIVSAQMQQVRAYDVTSQIEEQFMVQLSSVTSWCWLKLLLDQWLLIRLTALAAAMNGLFALGVVIAVHASPESIDAVLVGTAMAQIVMLTQDSRFAVRSLTVAEAKLNAVDRLQEYADTLPQEAPASCPKFDSSLPALLPAASNAGVSYWPAAEIIAEDVTVRYRVDLPPALDAVSFRAPAGSFVGVCGRTGSGKSTLGLALFRLVEPSSGRFLMGGADIQKVGIRELRRRLACVPQDPVIYAGSLRHNLDPFGEFSDDVLCNALVRAQLGRLIGEHWADEKDCRELDVMLAEGGGDLSCGERQLLCLARALLRSACAIVLDEATSSVDSATDNAIQHLIENEFRGRSTVFAIAHRIATISRADLVLVLSATKLVEFGSPAELLRVDGGHYRALSDGSRGTHQ